MGRSNSRFARWLRHWPRKKILVWGSSALALLLVLVTVGGYVTIKLTVKHLNANIEQEDITGLLGTQPVDLHPQAENIMVIGSDSRQGLGKAYGTGLVTDQSDTLMIIHVPADRQWAEVMSIPRDSWVDIPACEMGNGQQSSPTQFKINEAFATGNLYGNKTALGDACTIKTLEQDTGIYIDHFIDLNFTGFKDMVAALGGVYECNPTPINDPNTDLHLSAGQHLLTPTQALGYVRARETLGDGSDLERIGRQQAFMSSLISRVKSKMLDPAAIYGFLDALTKSLTVDSQLGGVQGLYNLAESLKSIPSDKIAFFTLPNYSRGDGSNVLWTQPEDSGIFASFSDDVPASKSLFQQPAPTSSASPGSTGSQARTVTPSTTPSSAPPPTASSSSSSSSAGAPGTSVSGTPGTTPSASADPTASIQSRTANQSICAG